MTQTPPSNAAASPEDPYDHCAAIAARNGSPLWLVGRSLPLEKRRFFAAAYASMRVIDDYVDTTFLGLSPTERAALRPTALARLKSWQDGIEKAACGVATNAEAAERPVLHALAEVLPRADLGTGPWQALGAAMRRDLEEKPIEDWRAFRTYCDGATVAPAVIFIYILGCSVRAGMFRWTLAQPPSHFATDIAVFCYLVHILRDLTTDAKGDLQLLTIPHTVLSAASLSPERLQEALNCADHAPVEELVRDMAARAQAHRDIAEQRLAELADLIEAEPQAQLTALYGAYAAVHDRIQADPSVVVTDPDGLRRLQRTELAQVMQDQKERL